MAPGPSVDRTLVLDSGSFLVVLDWNKKGCAGSGSCWCGAPRCVFGGTTCIRGSSGSCGGGGGSSRALVVVVVVLIVVVLSKDGKMGTTTFKTTSTDGASHHIKMPLKTAKIMGTIQEVYIFCPSCVAQLWPLVFFPKRLPCQIVSLPSIVEI